MHITPPKETNAKARPLSRAKLENVYIKPNLTFMQTEVK